MAPGRVGADEDQQVRLVQVLVAARHGVAAEGALVAGHAGGHAQPRIGVDVGGADEALRELVEDVVVLGQQLAGDVEGDRVRPVLADDSAKPSATWSSAASQPAACPSDDRAPADVRRDRSVSASVEPLVQSRPKLAGCAGSPSTLTWPPLAPATTPQPTPQ